MLDVGVLVRREGQGTPCSYPYRLNSYENSFVQPPNFIAEKRRKCLCWSRE